MSQEKILMLPPYQEVHILEEGVLIAEIDAYHVIEGDLAAAIVEAVQSGCSSRKAVAEALEPGASPGVVDRVISLMIEDGHLVEIDPGTSPEVFVKWSQLPWPIPVVRDALRRGSVRITSLGPDSTPLLDELHSRGVLICGENPSLDIVIASNLRDERLAPINLARLESRTPWMLVAVGAYGSAAALLAPGRTACWACLRQALDANIPVPRLHAKERRKEFDTAWPAVLLESVADWAMEWLIEETCEGIAGRLSVYRGSKAAMDRHAIRRLSACPACSALRSNPGGARNSIDFEAVLEQSGRRRRPSAEAFDAAAHLVSPMTGVVRGLCRLPHIDERMGYVYTAQHAIARPEPRLAALRLNTQSVSLGKGQSPDAARVSALYEGIERYSGVFRENIETVRLALDELPGRGLHPHAMLGFSERQYAERESWNRANQHRMLDVPCPFDPSRKIDWVAGWSLTANETCYVPAALTFYDHPDAKLGFAVADSNGCAAGERMADAVLAGLLECIERDAVAVWWYHRILRPGVSLRSFEDPWIRQQIEAHRQLGRTLWILDITTDIVAPVFVAVSHCENDATEWAVGFGCHWIAERAIMGALLEVNQVLTVRRDPSHPTPIFSQPVSGIDLEPFLHPNPDLAYREAAAYPAFEHDWPRIGALVDDLSQAGLEIIVVDQTHPDVGVPVVRVIAPGMAHLWRRLGVERLYRVPVKLGWLPQPPGESELNPASIVL